ARADRGVRSGGGVRGGGAVAGGVRVEADVIKKSVGSGEWYAPRTGVTLVELLVVLVLLGLVAGVSGLAIASLRPPEGAGARREWERARTQAIRSGQAVVLDSVRFLPDGRAVGPRADPLTGALDAR
ncbi:MAG: prepilin-type N-terminal cleavage/methylation domain-containing protein, partial [Gemmatimonadales bacterium]